MRRTILLAMLLVSAFALVAHAETVRLVAGQHYDAGLVTVIADGDLITITIGTENGWVLEETHVYVGLTPPKKAAPGQFPYKHEKLNGATADSYVIDTPDVGAECGDDLYVAVHAVVVGEGNEYGEETAWGEGDPIREGKNWAMMFEVLVDCGITY